MEINLKYRRKIMLINELDGHYLLLQAILEMIFFSRRPVSVNDDKALSFQVQYRSLLLHEQRPCCWGLGGQSIVSTLCIGKDLWHCHCSIKVARDIHR